MKDQLLTSISSAFNNPFATIDIETTGQIGGYHEIVQIAIVPMDIHLNVAGNIQPFYQNIKPDYPERAEESALRVHGISLDDLLVNAPTQAKVLDYLIEWFNNLPLGYRKRLTPIAHNWGFERSFLVPWLGPELFNSIFYPVARDTMVFATMVNDRAAMLGQPLPFERVNLGSLCRTYGIPLENAHDAYADCIATSELFKNLMRSIL